jgi:Na+-translocating ferredoxin:NAD+ oxidoreductase RnfG subunit
MNTDEHGFRSRSYPCLSLFIRGFFFIIGFACCASAEKFLTPEQAARLAFPDAQFSEQTAPITLDQKKAIEKQSGVRGVPKEQKLWIAQRGSNVLGLIVVDQVIGKHEYIDYAVALDAKGTVRQVEILEYREHYGGQVREPKWRDQFRGKTPQSSLTLRKDIYNITGATLSCRHVTEGVKRVLATHELVLRARLPGR